MVGHNLAATDTVLWMRVLDRLAAANPPKLIVIDPRRTATAEKADLHLAPKIGTNVALLNGILHLLIERGHIDINFIDAHTRGFDMLSKIVREYPPVCVEAITGVPAADLERAADLIGGSEGLVSTCLQGVYQSNQATAAACQVNNINLVLGRIGRPGCGILQMNGQPTSQNTRETGADGDLPGFRNWANREHIEELAKLWNVEPDVIPHWAPPTHALEIIHHCETGSIRMLWISGTNPAVSLPELTTDARDSREGGAVRDRAGRVHDGNNAARRRGAPGRDLGRENRLLHQCQPHRSYLPQGGRGAGRCAIRPRHLARLCAPDGLPRQGRRAADQVE